MAGFQKCFKTKKILLDLGGRVSAEDLGKKNADNCVRKVKHTLGGLQGVKEVTVGRPRALAHVTFDDTQVDVPTMHDALLKSGYKPVAVPV